MFIKLVKSPRLEFRSMPLPVFLTTCLSSHLCLLMDDFVKKSQFSYYTADALARVAKKVARFARKEGLDAHAKSALVRFEEDAQ